RTGVELHRIHELVDEIDSATVRAIDQVPVRGRRDASWIETGSGIADNDHQFATLVRYNAALDLLVLVAAAAVNDGIGQSFTERNLDFELLAFGRLGFTRHLSNGIHHG